MITSRLHCWLNFIFKCNLLFGECHKGKYSCAVWSPIPGPVISISWWRHQIAIFSALLALCEGNPPGNPPVTGGFPSRRPVTLMFSLICAWINSWANNLDASAHNDVIVIDRSPIKHMERKVATRSSRGTNSFFNHHNVRWKPGSGLNMRLSWAEQISYSHRVVNTYICTFGYIVIHAALMSSRPRDGMKCYKIDVIDIGLMWDLFRVDIRSAAILYFQGSRLQKDIS